MNRATRTAAGTRPQEPRAARPIPFPSGDDSSRGARPRRPIRVESGHSVGAALSIQDRETCSTSGAAGEPAQKYCGTRTTPTARPTAAVARVGSLRLDNVVAGSRPMTTRARSSRRSGTTTSSPGPWRAGRPRGRPPPRPRGHQPAGVHRASAGAASGPPAGADGRDRRPLHPDHAAQPADPRPAAAAQVGQLEGNCREFGIPLHGFGVAEPGHRPRHRARSSGSPSRA